MVSKHELIKQMDMKMYGQAESIIDSYIQNEKYGEEIDYFLDQRLEIQISRQAYLQQHLKLTKLYEKRDSLLKKIHTYETLKDQVKEKEKSLSIKNKNAKATLPPNAIVTPYFTDLVKKLNSLNTMHNIIDRRKQELKTYNNNILENKELLKEISDYALFTDGRLHLHIIEVEAEKERIRWLVE